MNINDVVIAFLKEVIIELMFWYISKDDAISIMNNSNLNEKIGVLLYIKWVKKTYYQRNGDVILNGAREYYKSDKKRLKDQVRNKYRELSEEERNIKREYGRNRYHNMSKEKKQKLKE